MNYLHFLSIVSRMSLRFTLFLRLLNGVSAGIRTRRRWFPANALANLPENGHGISLGYLRFRQSAGRGKVCAAFENVERGLDDENRFLRLTSKRR